MEEYISRDKVLEVLEKADRLWAFDSDQDYHEVRGNIKRIPSADVQPVKHGHWQKWEEDTMPYDNLFVVCSECGMTLSYQNYTTEEWQESFKYCPCCGVRMDGDIK